MKMCLTLAAIIARGAGMAGMAGALVLYIQRQRCERTRQFFPDTGGDGHKGEHLPAGAKVKQYVSLSFTLSIP